MTERLAAVLYRASELVVEKGWAQGDWRGCRGEVCASAALTLAISPSTDTGNPLDMVAEEDIELWKAANSAVAEVTGTVMLAVWNDWTVKQAATVVGVFRAAAREVEARGAAA